MSDWAQYPDSTLRETYPPAPTKGGNPNAEAKEAIVAGVAAQLQRTQQQEAEFRARQYQRRLQTRGLQAMRDPSPPPAPVLAPDDPALAEVMALAAEYRAAGWL